MILTEEDGKRFTDMRRMLEDTTQKVDEFLRRPSPWDLVIPIQK